MISFDTKTVLCATAFSLALGCQHQAEPSPSPTTSTTASSSGSSESQPDVPTREQAFAFLEGVSPRVTACLDPGQCAVVRIQLKGDGHVGEVTANGDPAGESCGGAVYPEPSPAARECIQQALVGATGPTFNRPTFLLRFPFRRPR